MDFPMQIKKIHTKYDADNPVTVNSEMGNILVTNILMFS